MKHIDKMKSSLIIALVAGFIYYAFSDFDTIKKIPYLAYETFKSAIETSETTEESSPTITEKKNTDFTLKEVSENNEVPAVPEESSLRDVIFSYLPDFSKYIQVPDFGGSTAYAYSHRIPKEHISDFGFNSDFGPSMVRVSDYGEYYPFDSNEVIVKLKIKSLDSLNIYLDESMLKLNEALSKLNEQLMSDEFLKALPHFDSNQFKVEVDIDGDELRREIEESMEDYREGMKDYKDEMKNFKFEFRNQMDELKDLKLDTVKIKFDVEEFKDSMQEFEENMKEYKENMKEYQENMQEFKENMKELKEKMKDIEKSKMKKIEKQIEVYES